MRMKAFVALGAVLAAAACFAQPARAVSSGAPPAPAPSSAPASAAAPAGAEVKASTAAPNPSTIYTGERLRDPFLPAAAGGANAGKPFSVDADFSIHNLSLRGIMKDAGTNYALFADSGYGVSFILRNGKLYDGRNKPVPGITGKLRSKEKWAQLETVEHDVQIFRLGEDEKE